MRKTIICFVDGLGFVHVIDEGGPEFIWTLDISQASEASPAAWKIFTQQVSKNSPATFPLSRFILMSKHQ